MTVVASLGCFELLIDSWGGVVVFYLLKKYPGFAFSPFSLRTLALAFSFLALAFTFLRVTCCGFWRAGDVDFFFDSKLTLTVSRELDMLESNFLPFLVRLLEESDGGVAEEEF